jgi:selenocysteine lyase/cysteine desulfurase
VAADYALTWGLENIWARVSYLADTLRIRLSGIPHVQLHDLGVEKCGIVTFTIGKWDPQEIQRKLAERKMNVSVSLAKYSRIDMDKRGLNSVVRASVHYYNNEEEIERFCNFIARLM